MLKRANGQARSLWSDRFAITGAADIRQAATESRLRMLTVVQNALDRGDLVLTPQACVCGCDDAVIVAEVERYGLALDTVSCLSCGTLRFNPYLTSASASRFYQNWYQQLYERAPDVVAYAERQRQYGRKILAAVRGLIPSGSLVLEVGCGAGGALAVFSDDGFEVGGCDHSEALVEFGRETFGMDLQHGGYEGLDPALGNRRADLIYLHHVLEHLDDPVGFFNFCRGILAPTGLIVAVVPDIAGIEKKRHTNGDLLPFLHIAHKYNFSAAGALAAAARANLSAHRLRPPRRLKTHCSTLPELWLALAPNRLPVPRLRAGERDGVGLDAYLREVEQRYALGRTRPQRTNRLLHRLNSVKSRLGWGR